MKPRLLIVDDDAGIRQTFELHLDRGGYDVTCVESAERALAIVHELDPAVVVTDVRMGGMNGIELVGHLRAAIPDLNVIVITAFEDMATAIAAIKAGAYDYLVKPLDLDQIEIVIDRAIRERRLRQRVGQQIEDQAETGALGAIVGRDPQMIAIYKQIGALARTNASVLIRGETGTGKEVIARSIHSNSDRGDEPFIAVNCSAMPEALLESELFGHVRGAFTGAVTARRGRFELAERGTIFLDEIGDISPAFQAKLLRVLQEREFTPVGGERSRTTDARVLAATHQPLEAMVRSGHFREDLYYRLRVVEIQVPALRDRRDDIPLLVESLIGRIANRLHRDALVITAASMRRLREYAWPGNVRELENELMRAAALSPSGVIGPDDLSLQGVMRRASNEPTDIASIALVDVERRHLEHVLALAGGNKRKAARLLRVTRPRFDRLLAKHQIMVTQRGQDGSDM